MYGANPWYQGVNLVKLVVQSGDPELVKMLQGTGSLEPVSILQLRHISNPRNSGPDRNLASSPTRQLFPACRCELCGRTRQHCRLSA